MPRINHRNRLQAAAGAVGRVLVLSGLGVGFGFGCGQGQGERCEIQSDCESGLICETVPGSVPGRLDGICKAPVAPPVGGVSSDAGEPDAASVSPGADAGAAADVSAAGDGLTVSDVSGPDGMRSSDTPVVVDGTAVAPDVASVSDASSTED